MIGLLAMDCAPNHLQGTAHGIACSMAQGTVMAADVSQEVLRCTLSNGWVGCKLVLAGDASIDLIIKYWLH